MSVKGMNCSLILHGIRFLTSNRILLGDIIGLCSDLPIIYGHYNFQ